jgi:hypothetical protein
VIHSYPINITCQTDLTIDWNYSYPTYEIRRAKVASNGYIHGIGFHFTGTHKYSIWNGTTWSYENGPAVASQSYADIVLDGSDVPYIAYREGTAIKVADRVGGSWNAPVTIYTLASASDSIKDIVLLRDTSGYLHVVVAVNPDTGDDYVRYATNTSGSWADESLITLSEASSEQVGSCGAVVSGTTLYIAVSTDYSGTAYVKHIYGTAGSWTTENADSFSSIGGGNPAIFFNGSELQILHTSSGGSPRNYLRQSIKSGTWSSVDVSDKVWFLSTVGLAANGTIHCFAFNNYAYPLPNYRIDYFQKTSSWVQSVSPISGDNDLDCCIHDTVNNILHVFYSDSTVGYAHAYTYL